MGHMTTFASIDDYVASFPEGPREILEQVRDAMRRGAPGSEEKIRYGMPALMFRDRYGLHFAGWKKHVGLYPVAALEGALEEQVAPYRATKDTVQFFYAKPVPYDLIEQVTRELASRHAD
jgi:uncharacterized protein YdhG (YjbR/CyaY superfamily)